jgi:hypothetical protein
MRASYRDRLRAPPAEVWIMYIVWPVTALYLGPIALAVYYKTLKREEGQNRKGPTPLQVAEGTFHCGAGCTPG